MYRLLGGVRPYLALTLLCLVLFVPGQSVVPPMDRDESRYVQATRQMLASGDYVTPHFQEEPRAKKPVGIYWLQSASVAALSAPEETALWPYRLPSLLSALAAVLLTFHFGAVLFDRRTALIGAGALAASLLLAAEANLAKTDAAQLACVVAAMGAMGHVYMASRGLVAAPGLAVKLVFWLAVGFGILIKGPVVPMMALLTVLALGIADRRWGWALSLGPLMGVVLVAAVVTPWVVAVTQATDGEFLGEAVGHDLLPKLIAGQESHGAPPGYYLLTSVLAFWPASLFLWPAVARAWFARKSPGLRFCLAWAVPAWIVFEIVPTKLPHYVLPVYPALALLVAAGLLAVRDDAYAVFRHWAAKVWYGFWGVMGLALVAGLVVVPYLFGRGFDPWSLLAAGGVFFAVVWGLTKAWRGLYLPALVGAVAGAAVTYGATFQGVMPGLERLWVAPRVAQAAETLRPDRPPLAAVGYHEPSLVFMAGTATALTGPDGAAAHLAAHPRALAAVEAREEAAFLEAARALGLAPILLDEVEGHNYSRGRDVLMRLYGLDEAGGADPE